MRFPYQLAFTTRAQLNTPQQGCRCPVGLPRQDLGVQAGSAPGAPHGAGAGMLPGKLSQSSLPDSRHHLQLQPPWRPRHQRS